MKKAGLSAGSLQALTPRIRFDPPAPATPAATGRLIHVDPNAPPPPSPPARPLSERLDVNSASERQLLEIPQLAPYVSRVVRLRPYKNLGELVRAGVPRRSILDLSKYIRVAPPAK